MPNPHRLYHLTEIREARGFTLAQMAEFCGLTGSRGRESVGKWERGESIPRANRRSRFFSYLRDGLALDETTLSKIWQILVEEWAWPPLSQTELQTSSTDPVEPSLAGQLILKTGSPVAESKPRPVSPQPQPALSLYQTQRFYLSKPTEILPPPRPTRPPEIVGFIGRETELADYVEKLNRSRLVVISGMAGVGKTALAANLVQQEAKLSKIFWHSFHEREGLLPVIWRLAAFLAWHGQAELWRMLQSAQASGGETLPPEILFDYLFELLTGRNYLLCFDDFHLVDDDLWLNKLVERLKTTVAAGETAIIITTRRRPNFIQEGATRPLTGLNQVDTGRLLARHGLFLPDKLLADLHQITGGNAQFLTLAIAILQRADEPARLIQGLAATDDLERYLLAEVDDGLSGQEQAVMGAVAVLMGFSGSREAIEAILAQANAWRALRHLSERHLLIVNEAEAGKEYHQHALVQSFYYQLLSQSQRRTMHRRAALFYQNGQPDRLKAGLHLAQAGDYAAAARLATTDTRELINRGQTAFLGALLERFKAQQLDTALWIEVKLALGRVYKLLGQGTAARAGYEEALARINGLPASPASRDLKARACGGIGDLLRWENPLDSLTWLQQGLAAIEATDSQERATLLIQMGEIHMTLGHYDEARLALEQGLAQLPEGPSRQRSEALMNLGAVHSSKGDISQAQSAARQALDISRQLHDYFQETIILNNLGIDQYISGNWGLALEHFREALKMAERLGTIEQKIMLNLNLGAALIYLGDQDEQAHNHLLDSLALSQKTNDRLNQVIIHYRLADLAIRQGQWAAAAVSLSEAERLALAIEVEGNLPEIYGAWAEICLARGQFEKAHEYAQASVEIAGKLGENLQLGESLRGLGQVYLATEDYSEAIEAFEKSLTLLENEDPYEAARTKVQWAFAILSGGDPQARPEGRALLHQAQQLFKQLGAKRDVTIVAGILSRY